MLAVVACMMTLLGLCNAQVELITPASLESLQLPEDPEERAIGSSSSSSSRSSSSSNTGGSGSSGDSSSSSSSQLAELSLAGGRRLRARLVVGADGGQSRVRELAGLRAAGWAYNQRGVVATGGPCCGHDTC
jgi:hypothetical protein